MQYQQYNFWIYIFLFCFGTIFGSFGSVLVWRLKGQINKNTIESILFGRSQCPNCGHILGAKDLVPIFSYIFSGGKCSYCKNPISSLYPSIEILSGGIFCLSYFLSQKFGFSNIQTILFFVINFLYVLIFLSDILFFELNTIFWIGVILCQIILFLMLGNDSFGENIFLHSFELGVFYFFVYFVLRLGAKIYASKKFGETTEGMGFGDVLMALPLGMLISLSSGYFEFGIFLLVSSCIGILFALPNILRGKINSIPFLPAMIITAWIFLTFGDFLSKIFLN